jgi:hypothetical protein
VDNTDTDAAFYGGTWPTSTATAGYYGPNYQHNNKLTNSSALYSAMLPVTGVYGVYARWTASANQRHSNVVYTISQGSTLGLVVRDQQVDGGK